VFADAKEVDTHLLGQDSMFDQVPDGLGMGDGAVVIVVSDVAEGIEAENQWKLLSPAGGISHDS
jgi:hypothetical protein